MNSKIGSIDLRLPSGKLLTSHDVRFDPEEPGDWPWTATYAEALRRLASDELVAIVLRAEAGDLDIDVDGCLAVLEQCRRRGITPEPRNTEHLHLNLVGIVDKCAAAGKFRNKRPN